MRHLPSTGAELALEKGWLIVNRSLMEIEFHLISVYYILADVSSVSPIRARLAHEKVLDVAQCAYPNPQPCCRPAARRL